MDYKELFERAFVAWWEATGAPVILLEAKENPNSGGTFQFKLLDKKLKQKTLSNTCTFYSWIYNPTYTDMNTMGIDLAAHIPSDADAETRIILRAAYVFHTTWLHNILEAYKDVTEETNPSKINQNCANAWYRGL